MAAKKKLEDWQRLKIGSCFNVWIKDGKDGTLKLLPIKERGYTKWIVKIIERRK